jgi:uncharacterized protein
MADERKDEGTTSTGSCMNGTCGHHFCGSLRTFGVGSILLIALTLLVLVKVASGVHAYQYIGQDPTQVATISVSGDADRYAPPDIADISYSVEHLAKTAKEAKDVVAKNTSVLSDFLKTSGVDKKDIQTSGFNLYPEYDYVQAQMIACTPTYCPPQPPGKQVLKGYRVSESFDVKIRDIDKAADILSGLAEKGATNVSGLSFRVENQDSIIADARGEAIAEAKGKAETLAKQLGVSIVRVQGYSEGYNYPYAYGRGGMEKTMALSADAGSPSPAIEPGQEKISSSVTITYVVH